jgi:hypothetical protein
MTCSPVLKTLLKCSTLRIERVMLKKQWESCWNWCEPKKKALREL